MKPMPRTSPTTAPLSKSPTPSVASNRLSNTAITISQTNDTAIGLSGILRSLARRSISSALMPEAAIQVRPSSVYQTAPKTQAASAAARIAI